MRVKDQDIKIGMRKNDFERLNATNTKNEIMKHKEKVESIYKKKLEDEKTRLLRN